MKGGILWAALCSWLAVASSVAADSATFTHDANGNLTSRTEGGVVWTYAYDSRDQLREVRRDGTIFEVYQYDAQGRRVRKTSAGGIVRYVWDGDRIVQETDDFGNTIAKYEYAGDRLVSVDHVTEGTAFYVLDALGSPVGLVRADGTVAARYHLDAWGVLRAEEGTFPNPFRFTGHQFDEATGLYYARRRFYDPRTGRFSTVDTHEGDLDAPPSLHRYIYAHDNPTVYTDPGGTRVATESDRAHLSGLARVEALLRREYSASRSFLGASITPEQYEHALTDIRTQLQTFISAVADAEEGQPIAGFPGHVSFFDTRSVTKFAAVPTRERWERETAANARILIATVEAPNVVAGLLSGRAARTLAVKPSRGATLLGDASRAGATSEAQIVREGATGPGVALAPLDAPPGFVRSPSQAVAASGETSSTRIGKLAHATAAGLRRETGLFDAINQPITTEAGKPILVPRRVDLRTGVVSPGTKLQEAIPDAVMYSRGIIVDDKPLGRPLAKDRQEIIRFITAYQARAGKLPERIAIPRYDPTSGEFVRTDLHRPEEFLPPR